MSIENRLESAEYRSGATVYDLEALVGERFLTDAIHSGVAEDLASREARNFRKNNTGRAGLFASAMGCVVRAQRQGASIDMDAIDDISRKLRMLNNLDAYIDGDEIGEHLRGYQETVFDDISVALSDTNLSNGFAGYIEMPTSTGKTAIYVRLAEALMGKEPEKRLKTLVLTPSNIIREQVSGSKEGKGFSLLDDDCGLKVSTKTNNDYPLDGDVDVVNYQALSRGSKVLERVKEKNYDLIICDEAHRAIGAKTEEVLNEVIKGKVAIGLTATAEYAANHHVSGLFPVRIHEMGYREAGELGITQPIRVRIHDTQAEADFDNKSLIYNEEDYKKLMNIKARNLQGAFIATDLVQQGKQGVISCIPGGDRYHAKYMAKMISDQIIDLPDGSKRFVKAVYIDGDMDKDEQNEVLEKYSNGEIDVLCYIDVLNEGWDEPNARFLINMRPTDSPVLAKQRIGRIMRKNPSDEPNIVVDFIDRVKKLQFTGIEAFDLTDEDIEHRTYRVPSISNDNPSGLRGLVEPKWMSVEFDSVESRLVYEKLVRALIEPAPEGYMTIKDTAVALGRQVAEVYKHIKNLSLDPQRYRGESGHIGYHLSPDEFGELASSIDSFSDKDAEQAQLADLVEETGLEREELLSLLNDNGIEPYKPKSPRRSYVRADVLRVVKQYREASREKEELGDFFGNSTSINNMLVMYPFIKPHDMLRAVKHRKLSIKPHKVGDKIQLLISNKDAEVLEASLIDFMSPPEGTVRLDEFVILGSLPHDLVRQAMSNIRHHGSRLHTYSVGNRSKYFIEVEEGRVEDLRRALGQYELPGKDFVSTTKTMEMLGIRDGRSFKRFIEQNVNKKNIINRLRPGSNRPIQYIPSEDILTGLVNLKRNYPKQDGDSSILALALKHHVHEDLIQDMLNTKTFNVDTYFSPLADELLLDTVFKIDQLDIRVIEMVPQSRISEFEDKLEKYKAQRDRRRKLFGRRSLR